MSEIVKLAHIRDGVIIANVGWSETMNLGELDESFVRGSRVGGVYS